MFLKGTSQYNKLLGNKSHGQGYVILEPCIAPPSQTLFGTAMYSLKFLAMQVRYKSCSMSFGKAKIWGYGGPLFVAAKSMGGATCIDAVHSSQEVWYPIRPASANWNKTFHSSQPENTFPLSAGVSRPYLPPAPNTATETLILFFFPRRSERRVLLIAQVCYTFSHLHSFSYILIRTNHLHIFKSAQAIFTSSHPLFITCRQSFSHLHFFLHIFSASHLRISSSHLHISSSHLHICAYHPHFFHIFSLSLSPSLSFSLPLALSLSLSFSPSSSFYLLSLGRGRCHRGATTCNLFARNEGRSARIVEKLRVNILGGNPFAGNESRSAKTVVKLRVNILGSNPFARNEARSAKTAIKFNFWPVKSSVCRSLCV